MENSYGIGVRNRYELFYDDDVDPLDLIKQTEKKKDPKSSSEKENKTKGPANTTTTKTTKTTANTTTKKAIKTEVPIKSTGENKSNVSSTQSKGPRSNEGRVKFSDREERNNRRNRPEGGEFRDAPPPRFDGEGRGAMTRGRGRGMGRGRGRGRGGAPGGPDNRGKREYDRQSGMATTGIKAVDKRDGSGSFNWGSDKDQIEEQLNATPAPTSDHDTSTENVEKPAEEAPPAEGEEPPKEDEAAKEMTLDEWKKQQGNRNKPQFNIRRAGEGENQAQWKKTYVLKKKVEEESDEEEEEEDEEEEIHHGKKRVILDIDFQFADSPARGRGRGRGRGGPGRGRGMDRGGRGGGGDRGDRGDRADRGDRGDRPDRGERGERMGGDRGSRGERRGPGPRGGRGMSRQEAPKMDDERDFPSLG